MMIRSVLTVNCSAEKTRRVGYYLSYTVAVKLDFVVVLYCKLGDKARLPEVSARYEDREIGAVVGGCSPANGFRVCGGCGRD